VVDYKTGNPDNSGARLSVTNNGDYLLQLYFYKLLIENSNSYKGNVLGGMIEFIEMSKKTNSYQNKYVELTPDGTNGVVEIIKEVYAKILELDFSEYNKDTFNKCDTEEYHYINWLF
jgi:hypothetical protein